MKRKKREEMLNKLDKKLVTEEVEEGLSLLEIDTELFGYHTTFSFKKAVLDHDYIWELTLGIGEFPKRLKLSYDIHIILSPVDYEVALETQFDNLKKNQLELLGTKKHLEEMQRIHKEYKRDRKRIGDYKFYGRVSEVKNKGKESLNLIVDSETIQYLEKLAKSGISTGRLCLVLEEI
jgi:hypothetical protein